MRLMAGLDQPTSGSIWFDGRNITGIPVQKRNVAMVYQQFINYPAMTVYENIASPLRVAGAGAQKIDREVRRAAELLRLTPYLDRTPLSLSGGQQQRTAIARAIVKNASVVLLDEPLANLDYKLREELREELPKIFAETGAIFVYATTEPHEALLLGGNTATLSEGRITQFGPTIEVFRRPRDLVTARTFSDPPLNTIVLRKKGANFLLDGGVNLPVPAELAGIADASYTIGFQPHHLSVTRPTASAVSVIAKVLVTEVTGSESFVHLAFADARWVMLAHGVHIYEPDETLEVFIDTRHIMVFDENGRAMSGSERLAA
jgi:glycerol transport system ATP-binding protein